MNDPVETLLMRNAAYKKTFRCQVGKTFTLGEPRTGVETYKVLQATDKTAVIQDTVSGEKLTLTEDRDKPVVERQEAKNQDLESGAEQGLSAAGGDGLQRLDVPQSSRSPKRKNKKAKN